jgi:hypothetical protein
MLVEQINSRQADANISVVVIVDAVAGDGGT